MGDVVFGMQLPVQAQSKLMAQPWEADASRQLRAGDPSALDAYEAHDRIVAGIFLDHV